MNFYETANYRALQEKVIAVGGLEMAQQLTQVVTEAILYGIDVLSKRLEEENKKVNKKGE